jgi:hypothetical protein
MADVDMFEGIRNMSDQAQIKIQRMTLTAQGKQTCSDEKCVQPIERGRQHNHRYTPW